MASRRCKGRGVIPGTIRGKDKNWFSEGQYARRYEYAMETAEKIIGQTTECKKCGSQVSCHNAAVTVGLGAVSFWKCPGCGRKFTREMSPENMEKCYQEDKEKMLEAEA